jgi:cell division protein FtsW
MTAVAQTRDRWRMGVEARALLLLTSVLLAFGLAVLYSASAIVALETKKGGSAYYLFRQLTGLAIGVVAFAVGAKMDAERWNKWAWPFMSITILLLLIIVLPFTTAIAPRINGSRRFLFGASLQPSEIGKLAVIVWTSMLLVKKGDQMRRLTKGLLPFLVVIAALDLLVVLEPDLSVAIMYTLVAGIVLFAGGVRIGHFVVLGIIGIPVLWHEMERLQYVLLRMVTFLDPGSPPPETKYQLWQSLIAVGSGGFFGRGFGEGRQSLGFVPFGYNDFIGSNIGEEWGFVGLALLTLAFAVYAWLGLRIARSARSSFLQLVAIGLTVTVVTTAFLHLGVVVGLLPTTGLTLPFISYGRSNLVLSLFMTGMLVNIGSMKERVHGAAATDPLAAPAW